MRAVRGIAAAIVVPALVRRNVAGGAIQPAILLRRPAMKATLALLLAGVSLATGCSSQDNTEPTSQASPTATRSTETPVIDLVGRWERVVTCPELTSELGKAGLGPLAPYAWLGQTSSTGQSSFAPGSPKPTRARPCVGALPREHSHFFDATGQFGSLDWLGGQVDDGTYVPTGDSTLEIGQVTFRYRVVDHDTLLLTPMVTKAMVRQALARPKEYSDAGWAVSVAYAGHPWKRVPCEDWC
jgi:hypothetical protein